MRHPRTDAERQRGRVLTHQLAQLRTQRHGLSQADLAHRANVSLDLIRKIEQAVVTDPGFFTVARLVRVLEGSLDELANTAFEQVP